MLVACVRMFFLLKLRLSTIPLHGWTTFCVSTHLLMEIGLFPHFGYCE